MEPRQFDALARTINESRSRRAVLGALIALAGARGLRREATEARSRRGRGKKRRTSARCVTCAERPIGASADLAGCDLRGENLDGAQLSRSDLERACLNGASLVAADLRSADLEGADLTGADLTDASLDKADVRGWKSDGATFCRTVMPDGSLNNRGCAPGSGVGGGRCTTTNDCAVQRCQSVVCRAGICQYAPLPDGTVCEAGTRVCRTGQCIPNECAVDTDCATRTCQRAFCENHLCAYAPASNGGNGVNCTGTSQCWDGACLAEPQCRGRGEITDRICTGCCGGGCVGIGEATSCDKGTAGSPCKRDGDCFGTCGDCIGKCRRFVCFEQ